MLKSYKRYYFDRQTTTSQRKLQKVFLTFRPYRLPVSLQRHVRRVVGWRWKAKRKTLINIVNCEMYKMYRVYRKTSCCI